MRFQLVASLIVLLGAPAVVSADPLFIDVISLQHRVDANAWLWTDFDCVPACVTDYSYSQTDDESIIRALAVANATGGLDLTSKALSTLTDDEVRLETYVLGFDFGLGAIQALNAFATLTFQPLVDSLWLSADSPLGRYGGQVLLHDLTTDQLLWEWNRGSPESLGITVDSDHTYSLTTSSTFPDRNTLVTMTSAAPQRVPEPSTLLLCSIGVLVQRVFKRGR
jgi:hypothetical protein